jgi:hypothetical protein
MSSQYWLLYDITGYDLDGPYGDIHKCRDLAVADASDMDCRVQIHKGSADALEWDGSTLVEEW